MRILLIGDIVGKPGRKALEMLLPGIRAEYAIDLVIANGENAAGGFGITEDTAADIFAAGAAVITTGDHVWDKKEVLPYLGQEPRLLRPLNFPPGAPGRGVFTRNGVRIVNLMGRVFMKEHVDCPFRAMDALLKEQPPCPITIVDFHAEASSEKQALGWYLDGRVTAVVGTHTHVPTADPRLLPKGTAFVTDLGMAGAYNSVIGDDPQEVLFRFLTQMPKALSPAKGPLRLCSVLVDVDEATGRARDIQRIDRVVE
ncbi:MAG: TIGR00282 family metallophosphoesterase [Chloroflexi bacterium]|nr:TIGR00282 family metallophosphoesterase [Chloroflexota bacterium]